jgi:hypothetical protein
MLNASALLLCVLARSRPSAYTIPERDRGDASTHANNAKQT